MSTQIRREPFSVQFRKCSEEGMLGKGQPRDIKTAFHGELRGACPTACLRFGGDCHSGKPECRKLRGLE